MSTVASRPTGSSEDASAHLSRERILDAAERLFHSNGYAGTGVAAVCRESGLPASSLYWHFKNKAGLLGAVLERGQTRMLAEIQGAFRTNARFEDALAHGFSLMRTERTDFIRLLLQVGMERAGLDPAVRRCVKQTKQRSVGFIEAMLHERFRADGVPAPDVLASRAAQFALMVAQGCMISLRMDPGSVDPERAARDLVASLEGIRLEHTRQYTSAPSLRRPSEVPAMDSELA